MQNANFVQEQKQTSTLQYLFTFGNDLILRHKNTCDNKSNTITLHVNDLAKEGINVEN